MAFTCELQPQFTLTDETQKELTQHWVLITDCQSTASCVIATQEKPMVATQHGAVMSDDVYSRINNHHTCSVSRFITANWVQHLLPMSNKTFMSNLIIGFFLCNSIVVTVTALLSLWLHCFHCDCTVVAVTALLSMWRHCCWCEGIAFGVTASLSMWLHCCWCDGIVVGVKALLSMWLHCCRREVIVVGVKSLLSLWRHYQIYLVAESSFSFRKPGGNRPLFYFQVHGIQMKY